MECGRRTFIEGSLAAGIVGALAGQAGIALADENPESTAPADAPEQASEAGAATGVAQTSSWRTAPDPIADDQISQTKEADFVVIGAAHAGGAVLRSIAEDSDHTVIGIEKQPRDTFFTMGNDIGHINSQWLRDRGVEDVDVIEMYNDWMHRSLNSAHPDLVMQWLQNSGADIDWYLEPFDQDFVDQLTLAYDPRPENLLDTCAGFRYVRGTLRVCTADHPDLNMSAMQQTIYDAILANDNAQMDFGMTACQLTKDDSGRVNGVIAQDSEGNYVKYIANLGVVLAAGDFGGNEEMRNDLLTHITDCFQEGRSTWSPIMAQDGSGIKMGVWAGGRMEPRPIACMNGDWGRGQYPQATIWLDTNGERYCNEFFGELPFSGKPLARIPHVDTWAIADANLAANVATTICAHDAFEPTDANMQNLANQLQDAVGTGAEGYVPPADNSHPGAPVAEGEQLPSIFCADTLEELADYIGYDEAQKANLVASVERWNEMCAAGVDSQYGKDAACLFPIDTPPYYAFRQNAGMVGGLMVTLGGLMTDKHQNVVDEQCAPIPGLYATGNCCGRRFGAGYFTQTPGNSLGVAITLGRELGKYLAAM
mgnify:CR=1 FL=1